MKTVLTVKRIMKIEYNLNKITEFSPNEYIMLVLVAIVSFKQLNKLIATGRREYSLVAASLVEKGFITNTESSNHLLAEHLVITDEGFELLDKRSIASLTVKESEIDQWIDEWRGLFPSGKSGGYPIKGSRKNCLKKMVSFIKSYGFSEDVIMSATNIYISNFRGNYEYIQNAHYFIEKNNISNLASFCDEVLDGGGEEMKEENVLNL